SPQCWITGGIPLSVHSCPFSFGRHRSRLPLKRGGNAMVRNYRRGWLLPVSSKHFAHLQVLHSSTPNIHFRRSLKARPVSMGRTCAIHCSHNLDVLQTQSVSAVNFSC